MRQGTPGMPSCREVQAVKGNPVTDDPETDTIPIELCPLARWSGDGPEERIRVRAY